MDTLSNSDATIADWVSRLNRQAATDRKRTIVTPSPSRRHMRRPDPPDLAQIHTAHIHNAQLTDHLNRLVALNPADHPRTRNHLFQILLPSQRRRNPPHRRPEGPIKFRGPGPDSFLQFRGVMV